MTMSATRAWLLALVVSCGDGGDLLLTERGGAPAADLARAAEAPLCDRMCAARQALSCPRDAGDCQRACGEATAGSCGAQWAGYFSCFVAAAPGQRICSPVGQPDLAPGVCGSEHGDVQRCLIAALSGS